MKNIKQNPKIHVSSNERARINPILGYTLMYVVGGVLAIKKVGSKLRAYINYLIERLIYHIVFK